MAQLTVNFNAAYAVPDKNRMKQLRDANEYFSRRGNAALAKTFWLASSGKFPQNFRCAQ
jgi:hypothetical protein